MEYAGIISDYHFDEAYEEGFMEEEQRFVEEVTAECMGSEFRIEIDNLEFFGPWDDYRYVMEDDSALAAVTLFYHKEIKMTPPYICISIKLKDKEDWYNLLADADGTVLVEIKGCFFRLEKKEE